MPFVNGISAKLAARSRHVCVLLGAGASRTCGLPDVATLEAAIGNGLPNGERGQFDQLRKGRNLEGVLTRLRRIEVLLDGSGDSVDGLTHAQAQALDRAICRLIVEALDVRHADQSAMRRFAAWVGRADYHLPVELFTVNYDLLLESALESLAVPYFDGFVGALAARFRTDLVEAETSDSDQRLPAFLARLWKLHGSVNWAWTGEPQAEVVRLGTAVPEGSPAAIYPSDAKYIDSRRVPFLVLHDRFRRALHHPETLVLISGYSFGDAHLNELIYDAAQRRARSEFIAFSYSEIADELGEIAESTPNLQVVSPTEAILGGARHEWETPEDAPAEVWDDDRFMLGDFGNLSTVLARSSALTTWDDPRAGERVRMPGLSGDD